MYYLILLTAMVSPDDTIKLAEENASKLQDATNIRYLSCYDVDEKDNCLSVVSFVLNSLSKKSKIVKPVFTDASKLVIKFDLHDYGFTNYKVLGNDKVFKNNKKLAELTNSENPIVGAKWFIVNAMTAPTYYKLLNVNNIDEFKKKYGVNNEVGKQAAIIINGKGAINTRKFTRVPIADGVLWISYDMQKDNDYIKNLLSEKFDEVTAIASNPNGLLSYFAGDSSGKAIDYLSADISVDVSKNFGHDGLVRVARNCVACHDKGIVHFEDDIRKFLNRKDFAIISDKADGIKSLFGGKLPIEKDQNNYIASLEKTIDMKSEDFTEKFVGIWKDYYADVSLEKAANEFGQSVEEFKEMCKQSNNYYLLNLFISGKISRRKFEEVK